MKFLKSKKLQESFREPHVSFYFDVRYVKKKNLGRGGGEERKKDALSIFQEIYSLLLNSFDCRRKKIISPCCLE